MQTNVKSPCQIQIDACRPTVCVNKFIFAFIVVSFFVLGWGRGPRDGQKSAKIVEGARGKKFGNHCRTALV